MNEMAASTLPFLQTLADARIPAVTSIMNVITVMGDEKLFVVISMIIAWCVSKRGGQYMLTVGFGLSNVGQTLKMIFRVPRPWNLGETPFGNADPTARGSAITGMEGKGSGIAKLLGSGADGWSFPSGHTLISVGTYGGMAAWFKEKWVRAIGIALAILIPFSRLYLGVHTPVDIIGGAILALIFVLALKPVFSRCGTGTVRAALIGNIALSAICLIWMYVAIPEGMTGENPGNYASGIKNLWQLLGATAAVEIAFEADERWLKYETKAVWWAQILKVIGGSVIVLGVQTAIQKIFGYSSANMNLENMTRMGVISCFANLAAIGAGLALWPRTFRWFSGLGKKQEKR